MHRFNKILHFYSPRGSPHSFPGDRVAVSQVFIAKYKKTSCCYIKTSSCFINLKTGELVLFPQRVSKFIIAETKKEYLFRCDGLYWLVLTTFLICFWVGISVIDCFFFLGSLAIVCRHDLIDRNRNILQESISTSLRIINTHIVIKCHSEYILWLYYSINFTNVLQYFVKQQHAT